MELSGDMPVTLIIKAPNQRMEDQTVDCMLGWTIKKLKQHLESVYPSKPKHNEQRLIYSGRLLQDHLTLKEILRQYDGSELTKNKHTVHLVCSVHADYAGANIPVTKSIPDCIPASSTEIRNRHSTDISRAVQDERLSMAQQNTTTAAPAAQADYVYTPEQYAWMLQQQMYSQYMMQYMQYYQNLYYSGVAQNPFMPNISLTQQPISQASPLAQQPQAVNNGVAPGARPNVRMNAQGGMEEEEDEGEPRDWLHHTYFFMRFLTFMGILFFYSNLTRFLIVFCGSLAIYVLQKLRKYTQRVQREQEQQQNVPPSPVQQQANEQPGTNQEGETPTPEGSVTEGEANQGIEQHHDGNRFTRACIFLMNTVQTFFTSLLPTPPELLEPN